MSDFMSGTFGTGMAIGAEDSKGLVFDLSGVDENAGGDFEVLPKAVYNAIIDTCELGESKKGAPMFTVVYTVDGGEYDGRKLYDYMVIGGDSEKAIEFGMQKLKKLLVRVCPETNLQQFNAQQFSDLGTAIGKRCRIDVGIRTQKSGDYKGQKQNNIKDILAPATDSFL